MPLELFVELKVPDNTARTAFHTFEKMGFKELAQLKRYDYYFFETTKDMFEKLSKVDILVNANKHRAHNSVVLDKNQVMVIIKDIDNQGGGILHTLHNRLGIEGIAAVEKGVAWVLTVTSSNKKAAAKKIAEALLFNGHFQEVEYCV